MQALSMGGGLYRLVSQWQTTPASWANHDVPCGLLIRYLYQIWLARDRQQQIVGFQVCLRSVKSTRSSNDS